MATSSSRKTELLPLDRATSGVWRYFGFPSKDGKFLEPDKKTRNMISVFESRYTPPDRKTLATHYLPKMFDTRILGLVGSIHNFAITTDLWTSRAKHAYTGLTIHYIMEEDFSLQSHLLATKEFSDSHTAENISEELQAILGEWNLSQDELSAVTTDNGSNIVLATVGWPRMPCFSHTLQLAVEQAMSLPNVSRALARCRRLVSHFNHSSKSSYLLKQKQEDLHHSQHSLIQDVSTRWNSAFYMVQRVLEQQQPLRATLLELKRGDLMPSDAEFSTIDTYVEVMKPLVVITEALGEEKWVTSSTVRPLLYKLLKVRLVSKPTDTSREKALKHAMLLNLQHRYVGDILLLITKAAFLDPRLKTLAFLTQEEKDELTQLIEAEATTIAESIEESSGTTAGLDEPATKRAKGEHNLLELIGDIVHSTEEELQTITPSQKARVEVVRYTGELPTQINPLCWWKDNAFRYPILSHLARKYLAIPVTSVPSKRAFSSAGNIVSIKRSCLQPESVNMLVFPAENLK